ncbi:MAG: flagellar motor switch protein FliN [Gammaproteobacteria bacterium]|nr:flagellar motor switch protein FliN [Gammaproteobacteria bacterium]MDJ0870290.1 flagellar motor switch protein FliN [Gammaproteobacteria bacterium]MDJ0890343.1 flagellar motor switch protein FliN [Gammaproteobacteria bacterium]
MTDKDALASQPGSGNGYTPAELENLQADSTGARQEVNLDAIVDIPVTLSVEIGQTSITIRELLQLNQGSVVELDRLAGEPLDVLVNGTLVAHGEVVVVNDKFGIRLTDVISARERVNKLQ